MPLTFEGQLIGALLALALVTYALFGGADYGGGVWDLLAWGPRKAEQRALIAHALGPVWEVNHVWLILAVVILFTGFPQAFAALGIALETPLTLLALGIVLRGAAFTFRTYDSQHDSVQRRWGRVFSIASLLAPLLLGMTVGTLASGSMAVTLRADGALDVQGTWLTGFNLVIGLLAEALFAFLAASYLAAEAAAVELRRDFQRRALATLAVAGVLALLTLVLARSQATEVFQTLWRGRFAQMLLAAAAVAAATSAALLLRGQVSLARVSAATFTALVLLGWAAAQAPAVFAGSLQLGQVQAPAATQRGVLVALGAGTLVLAPSLLLLFRVFKTDPARSVPSDPAGHG